MSPPPATPSSQGLSEPLGAALAVWVFRPIVDSEPQVIQYLLSGVGGLMVAVSAFELLPEVRASPRPSEPAGFDLAPCRRHRRRRRSHAGAVLFPA